MESIVKDALNKTGKKMQKAVEVKRRDVKGAHSDDDLRKIIEGIKTSIKVIGAGGAGSNTIERIAEMGLDSGDIIAVNTDAMHLLYCKAPVKLLIGASLTGGMGAGNNPNVGEKCAEADVDKIAELLSGSDMVFVTCGLGGGTGTGSIPVIAQVAKDMDALTIAIVTLPFTVEGKVRALNALRGLRKLKKYADTVIVIPNDKLLEIAPNMPLNAAFRVADEVLANAVRGITETITKPGLVNVDFADIRTVMKEGGTAMIGFGESQRDTSREERAIESVERALKSPLLDTDVRNARAALIDITGSRDMTLEEAELIVRAISEKINVDAEIIWGAHVDEELDKNMIKTFVILSGVSVPGYEDKLAEKIEGPDEEYDIDGLKYV